MSRLSEPSPSRPLAVGVLLVVVLAVSACSAPAASPSPAATSPRPTATATPSPTPTATAVALVPDGTAEENLPYFRGIVRKVAKTSDKDKGRAYIDALVAGGFDKAAMQVTEDLSTVGNPAESLQFSVLWDDDCLVGQVGSATGKSVAVVVPAIAGGSCLIGDTRPIDW